MTPILIVGVVMKQIENFLIAFGEEFGKELYCITSATVNTLIKVNGDIAAYTIDRYKNARFNVRLEDFTFEENQLSSEAKKNFYENITYKQLNYLFELFDKARNSTYDLHAKILSKIYSNLLKKGALSYQESALLSNLLINLVIYKSV